MIKKTSSRCFHQPKETTKKSTKTTDKVTVPLNRFLTQCRLLLDMFQSVGNQNLDINYPPRPHMALDGQTPADKCGIKIEGNNKWMTLIQNASKKK